MADNSQQTRDISYARFLIEFRELCERYEVKDYAIIAHGQGGIEAIDWAAGDGEAPLQDRARVAQLHFNVMGIADDMVKKMWTPKMPDVGLDRADDLLGV